MILAAFARGEPPPAKRAWVPFLWKIEGTHPSFLVGTMHVPDPRASALPPSLADALANSDELFLELELDDLDSFSERIAAHRMAHLSGTTLDELLPAELAKRTRAVVEALGGDWSRSRQQKPWFVALTLGSSRVPSCQPRPRTTPARGPSSSVEAALDKAAKSAGKPTRGIETMESQLAAMDAVSPKAQLEELREVVAALEHRLSPASCSEQPKQTTSIVDIYFSGDEHAALKVLGSMFGPSKPEASDLDERLIHERNQTLFERVSRLLSYGQPRTFAFGLWHMLGEDGLVSRLRRAGYKVERIDGP